MEINDLPSYDDLFLLTLDAVQKLGGSGTISEIDEKVFALSGLGDEALAVTYPKSGALIFPDRCKWARSYLKFAGLLDSGGRGVWVLTEEGLSKLVIGDNNEIRKLCMEAARKRSNTATSQAAQTAMEHVADIAMATEPEDWKTTLLKLLGSMPPNAFERLCQRLLRESGFSRVAVTGKSGDGGIDGHGVLRVGLVSFQVLFQAKRWQGSVGSSVVRDFRGAMVGRADKGLIITTSSFTKDARNEATRDGAPAIELIDGDDLCNLLKEVSIGVNVRQVEAIEIDENAIKAFSLQN